MEDLMRKEFASGLLALFIVAAASSLLSACNTTEGFGEDMSQAGHALSNSAERNKSDR
jgi:predicted small secreted protein